MIAGATVNFTGTFASQRGFSSVAHPSTGIYVLTLTNPPADLVNADVQVTLLSNLAGQEAVLFTAPNQVQVSTFDGTGTLQDRNFMVAVFDLT